MLLLPPLEFQYIVDNSRPHVRPATATHHDASPNRSIHVRLPEAALQKVLQKLGAIHMLMVRLRANVALWVLAACRPPPASPPRERDSSSACLALPRLASPCLALPRLASPCLALPRLALPRLASPCLTLPHLASP